MSEKPDLSAAYDLRTPQDSKRLYRIWAETYDADFVAAHGYRMPARIAEVYRGLGGSWPCLDVGCGTGAVGKHMGEGAVIDGLDISPDMLAIARKTGLYRTLYEADLTRPLPLPNETWAGMVSAGTFTTGHVGPDAIPRLLPCLRSGAHVAMTVKTGFYTLAGFEAVLRALEGEKSIEARRSDTEAVYAEGLAPEGHDADTVEIITFRKV